MTTTTASDRDTELAADGLQVHLSSTTGALTRVAFGDWSVLDRPELGESFRLLVPVEGHRATWVHGSAQQPPVTSTDENSVTATWYGVVDERGNHHDVNVTTVVRAEPDRIVFSVEIDNRGETVVENVYFPDLGDVTAPPDSGVLEAFTYTYGAARRSPLRPRFANYPGYYGVERPTYTDGPSQTTPQLPWILLEDGTRGLYLGVDEPSAEPLTWFAELLPGFDDSLESRVPTGQTIGEHPVALHVAVVHLPFLQPGERRSMTPIALAGYTGDWHAGADLYLARRASWHAPVAATPAWVREPHSWLQFQVNSPEGERRLRFEDLPAVAAECAAAGVTAIQLVGWNEGGQDQNNPSHDPDEALGGRQALVDAIAECRRLGVKIILFTKFTWADRATRRFREELVAEAIKDPYGDYYMHPGYRYQTVTQLLDVNTKRLVPMCFASERYLQICEEEFDKVVSYGADGMLYDEAQHHGPALLCFDPDHGHRPGQPVYANDRYLVERLRARPGLPEDFLFAGEAPWDWMFEQYDLGYFRTEDRGHVPVSRYLRPHTQLMTAVTGFDDRNMLNQCLLYRYVISYEPYNFKGRLPDAPATVGYGAQVDALRRELREWFWDGTFVDTVGVSARTDEGAGHHPATGFRHVDGRLAAVVANYDDQPVRLQVELDGGAGGDLRYRLVEETEWRPLVDGRITLPGRSAAVILPAPGNN